jgi:2-dehydro-3-deoxygluconokinase
VTPAPEIVGLGEPMIEFNQVKPSESLYLQGFGGDTSNATIAAARQGARCAYVTKLGDDEFGRLFLDLWRRENVATGAVRTDAEAHTAVYFVRHGPQGHVFNYLRAGSAASRLIPADLDPRLMQQARFLHTSGISQAISVSACDTVFAAIDAARGAGAKICYDTNLRLRLWRIERAREVIRATAALSDYFLPSLEDAQAFTGLDKPDAIIDWCLNAGARTVLLKLGADGVIVATAQMRERVPGFKVQSVDATGAGDCFAGALLARLCAGDDILTAACYANAAAALSTTGYGAVAPIPRPPEVFALLQEQDCKNEPAPRHRSS